MYRALRLLLLASACASGALAGLGACDAFDGDATSAPDAAPPSDGGSPVEAGAPLACPLGALLCDDFERADLLEGGKWRVSGALARLALDETVASSPTRSLRAEPVAGSGGALQFELAGYSLDAVEIAFSLRTDSSDGDFAQVIVVELEADKSFVVAEIRGDSLHLVEQFAVSDGGLVYDTRSVARLPLGKFERYRLRVDLRQKTASLGVASATSSTPRPLLHAHPGITSVLVGASFGGTRRAPHWVDDVVVSP